MIKMLRGIDAVFQRHDTFYKPDEDDHIWIPSVASHGWVIITGDKGIEKDGINRQSVVDSKAKVFLLDDSHSRGAEWAASLVLAYRRIMKVALENNGPFYCTIRKGSDAHVEESEIRFYANGGRIAAANTPTSVERSSKTNENQTRMNFNV